VFGEVDMEPLGRLCIESIRRPVRTNHMDVMLHCVDLGNVEMSPDLLLDEFILGCVKAVPCTFEPLEGVVSVGFEVGVVDEVEDSASCLYNFWVSCIGDDTEEHLLHVLVLIPSPLRNERYPFLEMTKAWVSGHCSKTSIDFVFPTSECFGDPLDQVVLEDALVELMKDIGGER